jgi:hypothetical protein
MTDEPGNRPQVHLTLQTHVVGQSDDVKNGAAAAALDLQLIVTIEARIKTIEFVLFFCLKKRCAICG